jgi:hypothetical protein
VGRTGGYASDAPVAIQAALVDASGPVLGARGEAEVAHPGGGRETLRLADDGRGADAAADDGVYTALYRRTTTSSVTGLPETAPGSAGSYRVRFTMFAADGTPVRHDALSFWVGAGPTDDADGDGLLDRYEALHGCLADSTPADDPDGDRLSSSAERAEGTDPCESDSDGGGEHDGSEIARRGGNPFDARDDLLSAPGWLSLVTRVAELHVPDDPRFVPQPNANLLRVPSAREYALLSIERREVAGATQLPWLERARVDPRALGGAFLDAGLAPGLTFEYRLRGIDADGNESAVSPVVAATVKQDPLAPIGALRLLAGPRTDDATLDLAIDLYGEDDPGSIDMRVGRARDRLAYAAYRATTRIDTIAPAEPTPMLVTAQLRDAALNESQRYAEEIIVHPRGSLGSIRGRVDRGTTAGDGGVLVRLVGRPADPVAVSEADGSFELDDLLPGTYEVQFLDPYAAGFRGGVVVAAGDVTDVGVVAVPEPGALAAALAALASLWLRRRYAGGSR